MSDAIVQSYTHIDDYVPGVGRVDLLDWSDYNRAETEEKRIMLRRQLEQIRSTKFEYVTCDCGLTCYLYRAYKCLYCGLWFCRHCAGLHFGMSKDEWERKKHERATG